MMAMVASFIAGLNQPHANIADGTNRERIALPPISLRIGILAPSSPSAQPKTMMIAKPPSMSAGRADTILLPFFICTSEALTTIHAITTNAGSGTKPIR